MTQANIRQVFKRTFKAPNLMTPNVIRYGKQGPYLYELSSGTGMTGMLYGVTVLDLTGFHLHSMGKSYSNLKDAEAYIQILKYKK